ncbi:DUF488 domain-containing protein [Sphingomonas mali]|uniref:DUF488 domain-containing protein n=1 Tax=Sphingomonas mali TaxID=40682 RepID=UPI0009FD901A|nr:DUF488 domain-containing protein [Sphingomonas mali]
MRSTLYTIGYEGAEISLFLSVLRECNVQRVIDIRDVPVSRKPGFSKGSLSAALESQGMGYTHLKSLGDPKEGRDAMRRGDYPTFVEIYVAHLALDAGQRALQQAIEIAREESSVLLCFERNPKECHRTIVANEMRKHTGFDIRNLGVNKDLDARKHKANDFIGVASASV